WCSPLSSPAARSLRAFQYRRLERGAIDLDASNIHLHDPPCVANLLERIAVEHQQISALAGHERAAIGKAEVLGGAAGRRRDHLRGRHAGLHHQLELLLLGIAEEMILQPGVTAEDHARIGGAELGHAALEDVVALARPLDRRRITPRVAGADTL